MYKDKNVNNLALIYDCQQDIPKHQVDMYNSIIAHLKKPKENSLGLFIDKVLIGIVRKILNKTYG